MIKVKVYTNQKKIKIIVNKNRLDIYLTEKPQNNKANQQLIAVLSDYYNKKVVIVRGHLSCNKIISY